MICRKCGVKNRESSLRCFNCGAPLVKKTVFEEVFENAQSVIPEITVPSAEDGTITEEYEVLEEVQPIEETTDVIEQAPEEILQAEPEKIVYTGEDTEDIEEITVPDPEYVLYTGDEENAVTEELEFISGEEDVLYIGEEDSFEEDEGSNAEEIADIISSIEENVLIKEESTDEPDIIYTGEENTTEEELSEEADIIYTGEKNTAEEEIIPEEESLSEESVNVETDENVVDENNGIQSIEVTDPDENVEFTKKINKKKFLWLLLIIPLIIAFIIGYIIFDYLNPRENTPNNTIAILKIKEPEISRETDENGKEYINAVFYGKAGDVLKLKCNDTSYDFSTDKIEVKLYLSDLFDSDYVFDSNSVTVDLEAYYFRDKDYLCETPSIELSVLSIETDLTQDSVKLDFSDKYDLSFWVEKDAKVTLNGEDLTVNHLGIITKEITPTDDITNFELKISKPYQKAFVKTITFEKAKAPINLTLSSAIEKVHSSASVTITYVTDKNASVYSNLPVIALSPSATTPDAFDVTLDISACPYGTVEAAITAKVGEESIRKSIKFNYWPNEDEILATAQTFDENLLSSPVYDKDYIFDSIVFTETDGMYKVKGKVNDVELIFDIKDYIGPLDFDTTYTAVAKMVNENNSPIFKLWYASIPEEPVPEGDETAQPTE